jgi:hypothetical protein
VAFFKKRIPTILGISILVAGLGAGLYLVGQQTIVPRASGDITPKEIKITNIAEDSFAVSWITDKETIGFVKFGSSANKLDQRVGDDRDQLSGSTKASKTHHVSLQHLKADSVHYFKLGSVSGRTFLFDDDGQPYQIKTAPVLGTPPAADTIFGTILAGEATPAEGAIVYVALPNAAPSSAVVRASGNWALSISTTRTEDLSAYATYDRQATVVNIFVQGGGGQTATAVTVTSNDTPVPNIILGNDYDFRNQPAADEGSVLEQVEPGTAMEETPVEEEESGDEEQSQFSFGSLGEATLADEATPSGELAIVNPAEEGESVNTQEPEFLGTGPVGKTLTITVESPQTYSDSVTVDEEGWWDWTPPVGLEPGEHTVTVSYVDDEGQEQKVSRSFLVLAAGESDLPSMEATPSATASPSAEPRTSLPSTESGVPTAGVLTPTLIMFILGLSLLVTGLFWQLKMGQR